MSHQDLLAIRHSITAHDADKTAHDYDCCISEREEDGCSQWGICDCGYGDARMMHGDYGETRSFERWMDDINRNPALVSSDPAVAFGKPDDGLAGGLESLT